METVTLAPAQLAFRSALFTTATRMKWLFNCRIATIRALRLLNGGGHGRE
jgi:hypothetical protein